MFGSKKTAGIEQQVETIIGRETFIKGTVTANAGIRVDGKIEGDIHASGDVVVGENGQIFAQIKARNAVIAGLVRGNIDIQEKLELLPTAKIDGDLKVAVLTIAEGAVFKGACEMRGQESQHKEVHSQPVSAQTVKAAK
ncbi:hypothetical protein P22_1865 [Propionispora sp. 2/2-37]|uniref:bactofilin family protein n=1 Tax=Propionispora sp. 2/2-37 TaxID=1677858 RepID=UPI0006BB5D60|nr:polymer-forming cytoskeletal protein [Propionispora sp. 2/2-37]CUH95785.1 hypothetical protein P22_1865 [Propionispora sp. 2/2-37]